MVGVVWLTGVTGARAGATGAGTGLGAGVGDDTGVRATTGAGIEATGAGSANGAGAGIVARLCIGATTTGGTSIVGDATLVIGMIVGCSIGAGKFTTTGLVTGVGALTAPIKSF